MRSRSGWRIWSLFAAVGAIAAALVSSAGLNPASATFGGTNGRLASHKEGKILTVLPDGSGSNSNYPPPGNSAFQPAWSADGTRLAVRYSGSDGSGIQVIDSGGRFDRWIALDIPGTRDYSEPTMHPNGSDVVFVGREGSNSDLYVADDKRFQPTNLTPTFAGDAGEPDFSPDGAKIAFSSGSNAYVMNADGSNIVELLPGSGQSEDFPSWSPDGAKVAVALVEGIGIVDVGSGNNTTIPLPDTEVWDVAWSPDGTQIAFVGDAGGPLQEELFVMDADGTNVQALGVDVDQGLSWRADPLTDLSVAMTASPSNVGVRDYIYYEVDVVNNGPSAHPKFFQLQLRYPNGLVFERGERSTPLLRCQNVSGGKNCGYERVLAAGESVGFTFVLDATLTGTHDVTVDVGPHPTNADRSGSRG